MRTSPEGTAETGPTVGRPYGTYCRSGGDPNVETLGYYRVSLRDKGLARVRNCLLGAAPSGIGQEYPRAALLPPS